MYRSMSSVSSSRSFVGQSEAFGNDISERAECGGPYVGQSRMEQFAHILADVSTEFGFNSDHK